MSFMGVARKLTASPMILHADQVGLLDDPFKLGKVLESAACPESDPAAASGHPT
jgi:hypothetical protein